jgi:predicted transcriptional regulator
MSFSDFIIDEEEGEKKRQEVAQAILKIVKPALIDCDEKTGITTINFKGSMLYSKECIYTVIVCIDYYKKIYRGMHRAIYVNIIKDGNCYRETDYISIDLSTIGDATYAQAIQGIKDYFAKIITK